MAGGVGVDLAGDPSRLGNLRDRLADVGGVERRPSLTGEDQALVFPQRPGGETFGGLVASVGSEEGDEALGELEGAFPGGGLLDWSAHQVVAVPVGSGYSLD